MNENNYIQINDNKVERKFDFMSLSDEKEIPGYKVDFISDKKKKSVARPTMYNSSANRELLSSASEMILNSNTDYSVDDVDVSIGLGNNKPIPNAFANKQDVVERAFVNSFDAMNTNAKRLSVLFDFVNDDNRSVSSSYIDFVAGIDSDDSNDNDMSKADALNRIAIASGDPVTAYNMYLRSGGLMKDRNDDYSEQGLISGFSANDLSSNLYDDSKSFISDEYSKILSGDFLSSKIDPAEIIKDVNANIKKEEARSKAPNTASVQNWLKNSPSGRYFNDLDVKRNEKDLGVVNKLKTDIDNIRKSYNSDKKLFTGVIDDMNSGISTVDRLRDAAKSGSILNAAELYIAAAEKELDASRPKEGKTKDIATSFAKSLNKDIYDVFGLNTMSNKANENLTKKLIDIDRKDPFALLTYEGVAKNLTKEELILLKSFTAFEDISSSRYGNKSIASDVGSGLYDSARFIAEMWLGGKIADGAIGVVGKTIKSIKGSAKSVEAASKSVSAGIAEADITLKGFGKAIAKNNKPYIKAAMKKGSKELVKNVIVGATMPGTYIEPNRDNMSANDYVYDDNGNKLASSLKYDKNDISDYVSKAAENSLSAFVEGGGLIRPALKVFSGILPEVKLIKGVYSGVNEVMESGLSSITNNGIVKKMIASKAYSTVSKLWDNNFAKSLKVGNPLEEMFEEFEEPLLKGDDMRNFFNTRNLMVTAATVGLFSGAFGAMGVNSYYKATNGIRKSEAELRSTLQNSFGLSEQAVNNYISLLDNAPVESLGDHVDALANRVYKSVSDANERGGEADKIVRSAISSMISASARYAANRARINSISGAMSSNQSGKDEIAREAIGQLELESANKAASSVVNSVTGNINTVYTYGLQKKSFLVDGAHVDQSGKVVLNEGNESGMVTLALPESGKRIEVKFESIHGQGEFRDVNEVAQEIASFNTTKYMDEMWINPGGKIPNTKSSNVGLGKYKGKSSVVALTDESNEVLNDEELKSDTFMPNEKNPITGKNGSWVRLVRDDETGTYGIVHLDTKGGKVIEVDKDGNAVKKDHVVESDVAIDENGQKIIEQPNVDFSSSIFDDEEDGEDLNSEFGSDEYAEGEDVSEPVKFVSLSDRIKEQSVESDSKFDGMSKTDLSPDKVADSSAGFLDTESGSTDNASGSFTQKFIDDDSYEFEGDIDDMSFLIRDSDVTKKSFSIRKLTRDSSSRRIDKNGDAFTRTLVFINKKREKTYNSDGTSAEKWVPFANSSSLLDGTWYDGAEVSVSTMPLETVEGGVRKITRAPIIIVSNKAVSSEELIFTLKSPRLLAAARSAGKITSHQYHRGVTMYNNIVNAVKTGIGSDIVIAIGKPKMSSFRMSSERNADGSKVVHPFRLLSQVNSPGKSRVNQDEMNFCIRIDGMLFEYRKGSTELEEVPFVNNVGSRSGASLSMIPPVIKDAGRDYTPILGPSLISEEATNIVAEILKSGMNESVGNIIEAFGSPAMSQEDSFLLDVLRSSTMTVRDFMKLFVPNHDASISNGVYMLGGNLYVNGSKIGKLSSLSVDEVKSAISGSAVNINLELFFDDMLSIKSLSDVLQVDESIVGNDLHSFLYSIATTDLDTGLYDPPFLFIDEVDLSDESVSVIGDTDIVNSLNMPQETLDKINAIYNKRSKFIESVESDSMTHEELIQAINDASELAGYAPIDFKVIESPNTGEAAVANEMTMLAVKWLAEKAFGATVTTDKAEIAAALEEIIRLSDDANVKKLAAGNVQGFVYNGKIYIQNVTNETTGHELAHILVKAMKNSISQKQYDALYKSMVEFGNKHPEKIAEIEKNYGTGGDKYIEFFCDEFGLRFNKHINDKSFVKAATNLFTWVVNAISKLAGTKGAKFATKTNQSAYNLIVRYAFNSSISDFIFINNIFNSNRELMERVSLISMFSRRNKFEYGATTKQDKVGIIDALFRNRATRPAPVAKNGNKSNLSRKDWELTQSDKFKDEFKGSVVVDDNDEPLKLYMNDNEGLLTFAPIMSDKKISNQAQSGFIVAKNVLHITDVDTIEKLFRSPLSFGRKFFEDSFNANGDKYDAISFKYGDRTIYVPLKIESIISSSISDANSIKKVHESQKGYRVSRAIEMKEQGHTDGSIAAATGIYIQGFDNGVITVSDVRFSDEEVMLPNIRRAIETGEPVRLKDIYTNSELLSLVTDPNIKVKIMLSDDSFVSEVDTLGDMLVMRVHSGVNKNDYKAILRDTVLNIIAEGGTMNRYRPLNIVSHVENQKAHNMMDYGNRGKIIDALNESKHAAISEWEKVIISSADVDFLDKQRRRILNETGWYVVNSQYMISGATVDAFEIGEKLINTINDKSFRNSFNVKSVLTDFVSDLIPDTLIEVKYINKSIGKHGDYDETTNTITLYIEKSKLESIKNGSDKKYIATIVNTIIHETTHAIQYNISLDSVGGLAEKLHGLSNVDLGTKSAILHRSNIMMDKSLANLDKLNNSKSKNRDAKIKAEVVNLVAAETAIRLSKLGLSIDDKIIAIAIENAINDYSSTLSEYGLIDEGDPRIDIEMALFNAVLEKNASLYVKSAEEASAFAADIPLINTVFRNLADIVIENKFGGKIEKLIVERAGAMNDDKISPKEKVVVSFKSDSKISVDSSSAYKEITANIVHDLAESIYGNNMNKIAENALISYMDTHEITGSVDVFSMVKQFITDLAESTTTTITDYTSFTKFMPFEHNGVKSVIDVRKFKDYMLSLTSKMNNVEDFVSTINNLSLAGDPFAVSIIRMDKICSSQGMSNYYERLFAYYNQRKMIYVDADGVNRTDVQLAVKTLSSIRRVNEIRSTLSDAFINKIKTESIEVSDNIGEAEAVVLFFEKLGHTVTEWAASEYIKKNIIPVNTLISEWHSELLDKKEKISSNSSLGIAIRDISIINNTSETAAVVTNGNSYPAVDRYNAIFKTISDLMSSSPNEIIELERNNPYMSGSIILNAIKSGSAVEIVKQVDEFSDLADSVLSDTLMVLSGNITLGKISTDGTRYYVTGSSLIPARFTINSDRDIDEAYKKDGTVIGRVSRVRKMSHSDNFSTKTIAGKSLIARFNGYALAEAKSIIKAYTKFVAGGYGLSTGYHIGKGSTPGAGCKFSELMNGVSIAAKIGGSESNMTGDLNRILDSMEANVKSGNLSVENVYSIEPSRDSYSNDADGEAKYNKAMEESNSINAELEMMVDSGLADDRMIAMYAMVKTLLSSDVNLSTVANHVLSDAKLILENSTDLADKMAEAGLTEINSPIDVVATSVIMKRMSLIEASKSIFGNPQEYGSIVKQEKRTQSFNTTGTIPVMYSELNKRPDGSSVSSEFDGNSFNCEFKGDLSKVDPQFYDNVSDTPGTVMISVHMYREILMRSRGWSKDFEREYNKVVKAYADGKEYNDNKSKVKFNPLKLIYVGYRYDSDGQRHRVMIKAQFVPLLSDKANSFNGTIDRFMDSNPHKRIHMSAMEDSVKLGFFDGSTRLNFSDLLTISVPRFNKKQTIPIIRKLLLFNDSNFNASIENESSRLLDEALSDIIGTDGLINLDAIRPHGSSEEDADLNAAIDLIEELRKADQSINPLDYACMFDPITNAINQRIQDIFEFKMKGIQCSAVTERFFTKDKLQFINAEGSMDIMVPMEYFGDIVEGLDYDAAVKKLTELGYIGSTNSDAIIVRNPAQSNASISPAKIVGVFPRSYGHYISTASEFLNANGGDYDGDKYFLFPVNQKNSPSANKAIFDMLMERRKTTDGNVDKETKDFENMYSAVREAYGMESKDEEASKDGKFFYSSYVSEISGLGLVGLCTNMISGLLSYVRSDTTYMHGNKIVSRTAEEIAESLSTTSALFSFAVDIATNPLLSNAGITPAKFKLLFAVAAISDLETAVKFMLSNIINLKADKNSGKFDFGLYTNKNNILNIVNRSLKVSNMGAKETEDERINREEEEAVFINTISRFSSIFSALKHSDDFYDYLRKSSYFDGIIQAEKVTELVKSITSANPNIASFTASNFKSAGINNARSKVDKISTALTNSSIFYNSDIIKSIYESIVLGNRDEQISLDLDNPFQNYKKDKESSIYNDFQEKVIMKKILAYVSYKIGEKFIHDNFKLNNVSEIKKYMIDNFGISFSFHGGYIHSVTSTPSKLLSISREYGDNEYVANFFKLYYASAAQRDYLRELNKEIKKKRYEEASLDINPEIGELGLINEYYRLPGGVLSIYDSVKYGVYIDGANSTTSKTDMRNIFAKSKRKSLKSNVDTASEVDSSVVRSIVSSVKTISRQSNGNNIVKINIPSTDSVNGRIYDSSSEVQLNMRGEFSNEDISLMKDLATSILLRLPIINTNLSDEAISSVLASIKEYNELNKIENKPIHFLDSTGEFSSRINSGLVHTHSGSMIDSADNSIIIAKNIRNINGYDEGGVSIHDIMSITGSIVINVRRNVGESASIISINSHELSADTSINDSPDNIEAVLADLSDMTSVFAYKGSDVVIGSTVSFKDSSDSKAISYSGIVTDITIEDDASISYTIIANGSKINASEYDYIVRNIDLSTAIKSGFTDVVIFTKDASTINAKKLTGLNRFYVVELKDGSGDYVKNSLTKEKDNNLNCSI